MAISEKNGQVPHFYRIVTRKRLEITLHIDLVMEARGVGGSTNMSMSKVISNRF